MTSFELAVCFMHNMCMLMPYHVFVLLGKLFMAYVHISFHLKKKATIINRVLAIAGVFTYYPVPTCFVYETLIVMHVITVI